MAIEYLINGGWYRIIKGELIDSGSDVIWVKGQEGEVWLVQRSKIKRVRRCGAEEQKIQAKKLFQRRLSS